MRAPSVQNSAVMSGGSAELMKGLATMSRGGIERSLGASRRTPSMS